MSAKTPHIHAEVIKAWADGAQIQLWNNGTQKWADVGVGGYPVIFSAVEKFRVKPEPKPDTVYYARVGQGPAAGTSIRYVLPQDHVHNIKVVFDGETSELKSVELIK